jgi:hypothetical protein
MSVFFDRAHCMLARVLALLQVVLLLIVGAHRPLPMLTDKK